MPRIIIAGPSEASRTQLNRLLTASGFGVFRLCGSEGELRRTLTECEDGIVLVCAMNPDDIAADFGDSFQILLIGRPDVLEACESPRVFKLAYPCPGSAVTGASSLVPRGRSSASAHRSRAQR